MMNDDESSHAYLTTLRTRLTAVPWPAVVLVLLALATLAFTGHVLVDGLEGEALDRPVEP